MTARELIEKLSDMPPDAEVLYCYNGGTGGEIDCVWLDMTRANHDPVCRLLVDVDKHPLKPTWWANRFPTL
jgi:hypothetical protein